MAPNKQNIQPFSCSFMWKAIFTWCMKVLLNITFKYQQTWHCLPLWVFFFMCANCLGLLPWLHISCGMRFGTLEKEKGEKNQLTPQIIKSFWTLWRNSDCVLHYEWWRWAAVKKTWKSKRYIQIPQCLYCGQSQTASAVSRLILPQQLTLPAKA